MMIEVMEIIEMKSETVKSIFEVWGTGMGEERERYTIQVNIDLSTTTTTASRKSELTMDVTLCFCKYLIFFLSVVFFLLFCCTFGHFVCKYSPCCCSSSGFTQ